MKTIRSIAGSFCEGMIFGSYTVGPVMVFLWSVGFITIN
jgi:hypothetical protein